MALRYAARRAQHTSGRVTLLCVAEPGDVQQWRGVEEIMRDEAHAEAEFLIHGATKLVNELTGIISELVIVHGRRVEVPRGGDKGRQGYLPFLCSRLRRR